MTPAGTPGAECVPSALAVYRSVHVGIGSNIEPERHIRAAMRLLTSRMKVADVSPVYRGRPVGTIGPDFLNLAVTISCQSSLRALKTALDDIEALLGRARHTAAPDQRLTARTIDLDILLDDTPANAAISRLRRRSARHSTIRARVATVAGTSALLTSARNSARSSTANSMTTANSKIHQTNVKQTESQDTR